MAYIEMVHSFKRYHMGDITITANNDVSFGIERGELAIILGSSGVGKSTVLNILGGMDTNSEGKVIIDGVDISDFNAKQLTDYRCRRWLMWDLATASTISPRSFPVASSSAWPSREPWRRTRRSCYATNRPARSTTIPASRCSASCRT